MPGWRGRGRKEVRVKRIKHRRERDDEDVEEEEKRKKKIWKRKCLGAKESRVGRREEFKEEEGKRVGEG